MTAQTAAPIRSACCDETVSRAAAGTGPWSCDNCHRELVELLSDAEREQRAMRKLTTIDTARAIVREQQPQLHATVRHMVIHADAYWTYDPASDVDAVHLIDTTTRARLLTVHLRTRRIVEHY